MSLSIESKKRSACGKHEFSIYIHSLSLEELDEYILEILYERDNLNYLFQPNNPLTKKKRILQLQRFIETDFCNREHEVQDSEIEKYINNRNSETYYSFFAEALLARLNIDYVDSELITGVIAIGDNLTKVATGADVCMYSDNRLIIGEAKFYSDLNSGVRSILDDASFKSKLGDFFKNVLSSENEIILKGINGDLSTKTTKELSKMPLTLSGFVLHSKNITGNYSRTYNLIDELEVVGLPKNGTVHLYHLPIESKESLIFKAQRMAIDLIIELDKDD